MFLIFSIYLSSVSSVKEQRFIRVSCVFLLLCVRGSEESSMLAELFFFAFTVNIPTYHQIYQRLFSLHDRRLHSAAV